jgi:glycerol dehydrogenase
LRVYVSPGAYVQGPGALTVLGERVSRFGNKALVMGGNTALSVAGEQTRESLSRERIEYRVEIFGGENSPREIERLAGIARQDRCDIVIGLGGGKALDCAKMVAYYSDCATVCVPTVISTDAPCSSIAGIHSDDHVLLEVFRLPRNPDLVLVDSRIIAKAPVRYLVAGIGDAFATWFEADACDKAYAENMIGGLPTRTAIAIARLCYDIIYEYGYQAKLSVEQGVVTQALEDVIEACTLLSGLGFESGGLAAAHALQDGFTAIPETSELTHGEKVAFLTLVQLVLEKRPTSIIDESYRFCQRIGLPTTLSDLGISQLTKEQLLVGIQEACKPEESIHNHPFNVAEETVYDALMLADALGHTYKSLG